MQHLHIVQIRHPLRDLIHHLQRIPHVPRSHLLQILHQASVLHVRAHEEPRGIAQSGRCAQQGKHVRMLELLPHGHFVLEDGLGSRRREYFYCDSSVPPGPFVYIREEPDAYLFLEVDFVAVSS